MKQLTYNQALAGFLLPLASVIAMVLSGTDIVIALMSAVVVESAYCLIQGFKWNVIEESMLKGGQAMLGAILIMMLVGIMIGTWMCSGTIPALLYYGMKIINPMWFLPVTFFLCILTSLATGTSWGTAGTMGIALIGVASGMGIPLPLVCGCILSGALIGDKMSPLSDSVLLASASSETKIFDLISCMMYTTVPTGIFCCIVYAVIGFQYGSATLDMQSINELMNGLGKTFVINPLMLLPMVVIIVMSIKRLPSFGTFMVSIIVSIILAMWFQNASLHAVLDAAVKGFKCQSGLKSLDGLLSRGGVLSMAQIVFASLMAGMFSGTLKYLGVLDVLMEKLRKVINSSTSLIIITVCVCILLMIGGGGQYTTLTLPGAAFRKFYDEMDVHSSVLGRTMEDIGTMIDCIIPWTVSGIFYSGLFGVSVFDYMPYAMMAFACPLMAIINAVTGLGVFRSKDEITYKPFWRRSKVSA